MRTIEKVEKIAEEAENVLLEVGPALPIAWAIPFIVEHRSAIHAGLSNFSTSDKTAKEFDQLIMEILTGVPQ